MSLILHMALILLQVSIGIKGFPGGSVGKESDLNIWNQGSVPGLGRSPGGGHGNALQYSCLENPVDQGTWWAMDHKVTKSWTHTKIGSRQDLAYRQ